MPKNKKKDPNQPQMDTDCEVYKIFSTKKPKEIIEERNKGVIKLTPAKRSIIQDPYDKFFHQAQHTDGTLLNFVFCSHDKDHVLKLPLNATGKSCTTSSLKRHPCFKKWKGVMSQEDDDSTIDPHDIRIAAEAIGKAVVNTIVKDVRPIRLSEGDGIKSLMTECIRVGVRLGRMPGATDLKRILPSRNQNKKQMI